MNAPAPSARSLRNPLFRKGGLARAGAIVACLVVAGCGFQRTYARHDGGTSPVRDAMSQTRIAPISDRVGQIVRNNLLDTMTPYGQPDHAAYWLEVHLTEETHGLSLAHDETITRYNYSLKAKFRLSDANTGETLMVESARVIAPYNVTRSEFATEVSAESAAEHAAELIASQIEGRVAGYFGRTLASR
jgi:LPS-assembly lipoprotein